MHYKDTDSTHDEWLTALTDRLRSSGSLKRDTDIFPFTSHDQQEDNDPAQEEDEQSDEGQDEDQDVDDDQSKKVELAAQQ